MWTYNYTDELYHFGVKGMKWGVRRYQKKNGKLTFSGKRALRKLASDRKSQMTSIGGRKTESQFATGSNSKRALSNRRKAIDNLKSTKELDSYLNDWYKNNPRQTPINDRKWQDLSKKVSEDRKRIVDSYIDTMKEAYIKDLGFTDVQRAKQYLDKYL